MYKLYYAPGTASTAIHWMLIELKVPFELVLVDFETRAQKSAAYLAINPSGHVPTLVVDGVPYFECAALLMLLAERHPEAGLQPPLGTGERAAYLQWMFYFANSLQPAFRNWFYPDEVAGMENTAATMAHARKKIEAAWQRIDGLFQDGRGFMLGSRLTALDFLATIVTRWSRNMPVPATEFPHLARYIGRMRAMPSLREVHSREKLTDWIGDSDRPGMSQPAVD
jgi:glutathione S-transferase